MTSPYVTFAQAKPAPRPAVWRVLLTALVAIAGAPLAVVAGFAAEIVGSGCFIECNSATDNPNPIGGALLGLLALVLALAGPVLAWVLLRRALAVVLAFLPAVLVVVLLAGT